MERESLLLIDAKKLKWSLEKLREIKDDELLVKTTYGAISIGSELPLYMGTDTSTLPNEYPIMTGYESIGEIIKIGSNVKNARIGDKIVSFYGHRTFDVVKESKAIIIPDNISPKLALLVILSCDAAKGVLKLSPKINSEILITGAGTMGLLTLFFIKEYYGIKNIDIIEPNIERHKLAKEIGARKVILPKDEIDFAYDYGFECSGRNSGFEIIQKNIKKNGSICILSDGNYGHFTLLPEFHSKELTIIASSDGWDYKKHAEWYFSVITKHHKLEKIFQYSTNKNHLINTFNDLSKGKINPLKVVIDYNESTRRGIYEDMD